MPHDRLPEPWYSFFAEIDQTLDQPVALHCIGGFAIAMLYRLPRPTLDVEARDREDVKYLARAAPLDLSVLEGRYHSELRPYLPNAEMHDLTMRLWREMLSEA